MLKLKMLQPIHCSAQPNANFLFVWHKLLQNGTYQCLLALLVCVVLSNTALAQFQNYNAFDTATQKSLDELNKLILTGSEQQIQQKIQEIVSNAGYISPLARAYYRMAQNEENGNKVIEHYQSIIKNWPDSAWAQKTAIEFVPLYLMSNGQLGKELETTIWNQMRQLISPAEDAASIGEDPAVLVRELQKQLINLAYFRDNLNTMEEISSDASLSNQFDDQIELMMAFDLIQKQQAQEAQKRLTTWLSNHSNSAYAPVAYLGLFRTADSQQQKIEIAQRMNQRFPGALETKMVLSEIQ